MKKMYKRAQKFKTNFFILRKNEQLMKDKILDYSLFLKDGIATYKIVTTKFTIAILLGILLNKFIIPAVICLGFAVYFIILMLKYTKYNFINKVVNKLAHDMAFKGIYDKEKVENMVHDFKDLYGELCIEFDELVKVKDKYEKFIMKLECILKGIEIEKKRARREKKLLKEYNTQTFKCLQQYYKKQDDTSIDKIPEAKVIEGYVKDENSMLYKDEEGKIKEAEKVLDFFDNNKEENNTVILKNNSDKKKLKVYLYKRNCNLQNNAL